jgi:hypothetical protein
MEEKSNSERNTKCEEKVILIELLYISTFQQSEKNVSPVTYTHPFHSNDIEREKWIKEKFKAGMALGLMKKIVLGSEKESCSSYSCQLVG